MGAVRDASDRKRSAAPRAVGALSRGAQRGLYTMHLYQGVVVLLRFCTRMLYMRVLDTPGLVWDASDRKRLAPPWAVGAFSRGAQRGAIVPHF